jgi:4-hydroxy-2-oxoheptanedioate aldolase
MLSDSPAALERLRRRQPVFGALQTICAPTLTEIAILSGYDFIILDCEHSVLDEPAHLLCLQAISGTHGFAVVRVRRQDFDAVGRYLDLGAHAILLPDVRSVTDASAFVAAATHGPHGTRSSTGARTRAQQYGLASHRQSRSALLLAMIEGARAIDAIDAIAATPGLDGLVIGPHDLAADLGVPADFSAPVYVTAFAAVERAAKSAGLILGSRIHPGFPIERLLEAGHRFILAGSDVAAVVEGYRLNLLDVRG